MYDSSTYYSTTGTYFYDVCLRSLSCCGFDRFLVVTLFLGRGSAVSSTWFYPLLWRYLGCSLTRFCTVEYIPYAY